jgi:hypothetical protein
MVRNVAPRFLLWIKTTPTHVLPPCEQLVLGPAVINAFVHRSALFVWLPVLEGTISDDLLHPGQNPLVPPKYIFSMVIVDTRNSHATFVPLPRVGT